MKFPRKGYRVLAAIFWMLALLAVVIWVQVPRPMEAGWDLNVYKAAAHTLKSTHDPYAEGMSIQRTYHAQATHAADDPPPFTYVYSPLTLPLLKVAGWVPVAVSASFYWLIYGVAVIAAIWVCMQMVQRREAVLFTLLAPLTIFFPGLLKNDVILSGNIAYILHGTALLAAYAGWKRDDWRWFYGAVLCASCFKAPMVYLLAIPILSAYRQWRPAAITGALGTVLFAVQPLIWPGTFRHYLEAVELQFSFNHDFSSSPAGLLADALYYVVPYKVTSSVFYVLYAALFFAILFFFSRRFFLAGRITWRQWAPFLVVGVLLLNPRVMEYDIAPITVAMALVLWRFLGRGTTRLRTAFTGLCLLGALNVAAPRGWRVTECIVLICLFTAGAWDLATLDSASNKSADGEPTREADMLPEHQDRLHEVGA